MRLKLNEIALLQKIDWNHKKSLDRQDRVYITRPYRPMIPFRRQDKCRIYPKKFILITNFQIFFTYYIIHLKYII